MPGIVALAGSPSSTRDTPILSEQFNGRPMAAIWPQAAMTTLSVSGMPKLLTAQIWDIVAGCKILTYEGHTSEVYSIAWSPNSKRIASGGGDGTFQIWDAITGNTLFTDRNRSTAVRAVAWSPDGLYLACTSYDKTVDVWQMFGK